MCVGLLLGDASAELVRESSVPSRLYTWRVSSGEEGVCASRRPLGVNGACCRMLGLRIEGSREEGPAEGGEDGRREDIIKSAVYVCIGYSWRKEVLVLWMHWRD